jgi:two-component system response regulator HydG
MAERAVPRVLVVDDKREMADMVADGLADHGFSGLPCAVSRDVFALLAEEPFDAVVTDLRMPDVDGLQIVERAVAMDPDRPVVVMTAYGAVDTAIESMRRGAYHYVTKPFKVEELAIFLRRALQERRLKVEAKLLRRELRTNVGHPSLIGRSAAMRELTDVVSRVADTDAPVLLLGETGTGKSLLASTIHAESRRATGPFVTVNCAALPEQLLESELFGHTKGAFTGAASARTGLFVEADGGTMFLDEIGDMAPALQAKLLDVLERGKVRPVGEAKERSVDVRVLAATHRNLKDNVLAGTFREDLLFRLDVVSFEVPPLRNRKGDIPALVEHFFQIARGRHTGSPARSLSPEAIAKLLDYPWPGNVRELAHLMERLVVLAKDAVIAVKDLPQQITTPVASRALTFSGTEIVSMREVERRYARWAYDSLSQHRARTADKLGIDVKTLSRLLVEPDASSS